MTAAQNTPPHPPAEPPPGEENVLVVEDQFFALVPEWVIEADVPDGPFRLYCLLLRYGNSSGVRMPSRGTLARRLGRSTDAIDRAMRALEKAGLVVVQHRQRCGATLTNQYHLRTQRPSAAAQDDAGTAGGGGRTSAAPSPVARPSAPPSSAVAGSASARASVGEGRESAAPRRTFAEGAAADPRPNPEISTQRSSPPPPPSPAPPAAERAPREEEVELLTQLGLRSAVSLDQLAGHCAALRAAHGCGATLWKGPHLIAALQVAVGARGWPAHLATVALLKVAKDPATRSPMRVAEAGPWWDEAAADVSSSQLTEVDVEALEERLQALGGGRVAVQMQARAELHREDLPLTRTTVFQRACEILDRQAAS